MAISGVMEKCTWGRRLLAVLDQFGRNMVGTVAGKLALYGLLALPAIQTGGRGTSRALFLVPLGPSLPPATARRAPPPRSSSRARAKKGSP